MELHPGQTAGKHRRHNLVETGVHENAILLYLAGQFFRDLANQFSLDLPWTWSKNESHCVRTTFCRKTRIFKVGVAADFDPHSAVSLGHGRGRKQILQRFFRVGLAHERFTDQEGVEPNRPQAVHVFSRLDAALAHVHGAGR